MSGYFIAGTDTGVGKTSVSAALMRKFSLAGHKVAAMKPVASGCQNTEQGLRNEDAQKLLNLCSVAAPYETVNPYAFEPAIAPHLAAMDAGIKIELEIICDRYEALADLADIVIVEGVGGWQVPLGRVITTEHMAKALDLPVVLVVGMRLGCLNHALLTAQAIESAGLELSGWVANQMDSSMDRVEQNIDSLCDRMTAPLLGRVPYFEKPEPGQIEQYLNIDSIGNT